jgi:rSAM/selenodomain-associated transferase 1
MQRLILFAKRPIVGRVKTRLSPPLSPEQARDLYRAFLIDSMELIRGLAAERTIEVAVDEPWVDDAGLFRDVPVSRQRGDDLGQRLLHAFQSSHAGGATATVVLGSDSPTLPRDLVVGAFDRLNDDADVVLSPAADGGYVLLGMGDPQPTLFREIPWGGTRVAERTRERARESALKLVELPGWYDVDDPVGLQRLRNDLADPAVAARAPATHRTLLELDALDEPVL